MQTPADKENKEYKYLFSTEDSSSRMRKVYQSITTGLVRIIGSKELDNADFKRQYNVFVDAYKKRGIFEKIRNCFHQLQANLYIRERSALQDIFSYLLTPVPKIYQYGKFLDVGCNTGNFLEKLPDRWGKYGLEINKDAYSIAKSKKNISVYNGTLENFETEEKFDFIRVSHTIEHTKNRHLFLDKLYNLLAKNGYLLVYTPNTQSLSYLLFGKNWEPLYETTHFTLFNLKNLTDVCNKKDFKIVEKGTYYMGITAGSLLRAISIPVNSVIYKPLFFLLFLFFYPFSFLANLFNLGGALYVYVEK